MSTSKIKTIFQPFTVFQTSHGGLSSFPLKSVLQSNFSINTWMLVGASVHAIVAFILPSRPYVLLISFGLLLLKLFNSFLQAHGVISNPYLEGVIPGRTTALLPDKKTGEFNLTPTRKIAVFHLGAKANHPYGYFAPQFQALGQYLAKMNEALDSGEVKGFLGQTTFNRLDAKGAPEAILISYWESVEDLWGFAHSEVHKVGWQWWEKTIKDNGYVGINHEIFEADAEHWETIYANFQPTLMGATSHLVKGGKIEGGTIEDKYLNSLVDARRGPLARSSGRMGRPITTHDEAKGERPTYV